MMRKYHVRFGGRGGMSSQEASPSRPNAEMGAAYLCAEAGIANAVIANQAAYVAGWLKKLRDDSKLLIHAAAQAQRAANYVLNRTCHE
jgi:antirestriction protein ArdC